MSRRRRNELSADGVKDGQRVIDALDLAVIHEMIATFAAVEGRFEQIPTPPPRSDAWFVEQEAKSTSAEAMRPDADRTSIDLVRWRAVRQAHKAGLPWRKAYESASDTLKGHGPPFAGSWSTMKRSHDTIQRYRKATRTTKQP
ncbi:MAG TPA: hypothetical protein VNZ23_04550 [Xanthobacteraceae bacterium]|jgi:hypothetical protein|nr:hypothetical protein [Xanthobacteraceae bacterium]